MKKIFISIMFILAMAVPAFAADVDFDLTKGTTFIISNEGGLIDKLIKEGYGDYNLYQVLQVLQPYSNGVISDEFLTALASYPSSEIFTFKLSTFGGTNNPVGVSVDGTMMIIDIRGKDYIGETGYNTTPDAASTNGQRLFTYATGSGYYIDTGVSTEDYGGGIITSVSTYYAFAIAWSMPTTFVLSNEGGLIDKLVNEGYGAYNLYQVVQLLQPESNGVITDEFVEALANSPSGSEIFTAKFSLYAPSTMNPIAINSDGSVFVVDCYGNQYYGETGYSTTPDATSTSGQGLFTYATGENFYIDTGSSVDDGSGANYKAFAVAWSMPTSISLSNEGGLIDELVAAGYGAYGLYDTLVALQPQSGGVITDTFLKALKYSPSGSDVFSLSLNEYSGTNNPVVVNSDGTLMILDINGTDYYSATGYNTYKADQAGIGRIRFTSVESSDYYIDTGIDSGDIGSGTDGVTYQAIGIIWSK